MTFKSSLISFVITCIVIALLHVFFAINLLWLLLPSSIFLLALIYGSANINANFFVPVFCCADTAEKYIALSFDDGPNQVYTPQVLETLAQHEVLATFFVIGKNILGNEDILKQIDAKGHSIGNHSYTHSNFIDFKSTQGFKHELNQTAESVFKVIGKRVTLFRPPFGVITPHLAKAAMELSYHIIGWSVRSFDTTADSIEVIAERVQAQMKPGAIILFHDGSYKTVQALKQTLDFAKDNDYKVVGIEQLLNIKAYE